MNKKYIIALLCLSLCNNAQSMDNQNNRKKRKRGLSYSSSEDFKRIEKRKQIKINPFTVNLGMTSNALKALKASEKDSATFTEKLNNIKTTKDDRKKIAFKLLKKPTKLQNVLESGSIKLNRRIQVKEIQGNKGLTIEFGEELFLRIIETLQKCDKKYLTSQQIEKQFNNLSIGTLNLTPLQQELDEIDSKAPEKKLALYQMTLSLLVKKGLKIKENLIYQYADALDYKTLEIIGVKIFDDKKDISEKNSLDK